MADKFVRASALEEQDWRLDRNLKTLRCWARAGHSQEEIAERMGVSLNVLKRWRMTWPEIDNALNASWEEAVHEVENALYRRALGYEVQETAEETTELADGSIETKTTRRERVIPGETTAMIFFLKNRAPERWNDRKLVSADVTVKVMEQQAQDLIDVMDMALMALNLTPDQRARLPQLVQQAIDAKGLASGTVDPEAKKALEAARVID